VHSFETHEHLVCKSQNKLHFDSHEIDCAVFHFKINTNTIDFNSTFTAYDSKLNIDKIYTGDHQIASVKLHFKSSRAPPFLLT
jgi:GTP cyclohydrolase III